MKEVKRLYTIDLDTYEKALGDLNLYHDMLLQLHEEALTVEADPDYVENIMMQSDIIAEVLVKLRTSVVNGANYNPGDNPTIH